MAKEKIGEVTTPTNATFYVFWDKDTGEVYVGSERAGNASSKEKAFAEANYYATTSKSRS
jgi:hypothetical protein